MFVLVGYTTKLTRRCDDLVFVKVSNVATLATNSSSSSSCFFTTFLFIIFRECDKVTITPQGKSQLTITTR